MSNSIILVIVILIITWLVVYFYYHCKNETRENLTSLAREQPVSSFISDKQITTNKPLTQKHKKVRFNDNVKYNTYKKINVDDILSLQKNENYIYGKSDPELDKVKNKLSEMQNKGANRLQTVSISDNSINSMPLASNLDQSSPGDRWDANFGVPLYTQAEQKKFVEKMQRNMENYAKSLGEMVQYQTDKNTIIQTDTTIDPFKPPVTQRGVYQGRTVKEIYDEQVAGPRAIPKRIKQKTPTTLVYEDESEMNGGIIKGSKLHGFDGIKDGFQSAAFGDGFNVNQFI